MKTTKILAVFTAFALCPRWEGASQTPVAQPVDIQTLRGAKSGSGVQLTWTDGVSTFTYARNDKADFSLGSSLRVAGGISVRNYFDAGSLTDGLSHFYLITDATAPPTIFDISPSSATSGDTVTVRGLGLSGATLRDSAHSLIPSSTNTDTQITFGVPATGFVSGPIVLNTSNGAAIYAFIRFDLHKVGVSGLTVPGNILYDEVNNLVFYTDRQTTAATRLWKYNPATGISSPFGTVWPPRIAGLALGPWQGGGRYVFLTDQTSTTGNSLGNVYRYDTGSGIRTLVGPLTSSATSDPVACHAVAIGPNPYSTDTFYSVFALTMPNTSFPSYVRFLKTDGTLPPRADWQAINVSGGVTTVNSPGGLLVTGAQGYYFTNGISGGTGERSSVEYWRPGTGTPPAHALAFTSTYPLHKIANAATLALDLPDSALPSSVWVANRGNPFVTPALPTSIVKLNVIQSGSLPRATPQSIELYRGQIGDAKSVSPQYADSVLPGRKFTKYLWATDDFGMRYYRALRQIKYKVFIASNAGQPIGPYTKPAKPLEVYYWVKNNIAFANLSLQGVGFQTDWDGSAQDVDDTSTGFSDHSVALLDNVPLSSTCSAFLSTWSGLFDEYAVNVMVVHGIRDRDGDATLSNALGVALRNKFVNCNGKQYSIVLLSYGSPSSPAPAYPSQPRATFHVLDHETGHYIINYDNAPVGQYDLADHSTDVTHVMNSTDDPRSANWLNTDDIVINTPINPVSKLFLPEGGAP